MSKACCDELSVRSSDAPMRVDYSEATGRLRILRGNIVLREWFPPHSWIAIASTGSARNWGTHPEAEELRAFLMSRG
jgi:hypothetical protein